MAVAKVYVTLKKGILDPQGKAVKSSLASLGFQEVEDVRVGRYLEVLLEDSPRDTLEERVREMCQRLLSNPVIEDYRFEIERAPELKPKSIIEV